MHITNIKQPRWKDRCTSVSTNLTHRPNKTSTMRRLWSPATTRKGKERPEWVKQILPTWRLAIFNFSMTIPKFPPFCKKNGKLTTLRTEKRSLTPTKSPKGPNLPRTSFTSFSWPLKLPWAAATGLWSKARWRWIRRPSGWSDPGAKRKN